MTDGEFRAYLKRLETWDKNAIPIVLYSDLDPLIQHQRILELRETARQWIDDQTFDTEYREAVETLIEGNRKRLQSGFAPFAPFASTDLTQLPPFPVEDLPPALRDCSEALAESMQVSVDMAAVACLSVVSVCLQGKVKVQPKPDWTEPLNLFSVVVALPSERKSPTLREATAPLYDFVREENERRKPAIDRYQTQRNALVNAINKMTNKPIDEILSKKRELAELEQEAVHPLRLLADDVTPEKLVDLMADNDGKMALISAEGGIFDTIAGRYNDRTNLDVFLKAYSGDPVMIDRKTSQSKAIDNPVLTLLLMIQPRVLQGMMENRDFEGRGFLSRFLYCLPPSTVGQRTYESKPIPEPVRYEYERLLRALLAMPDEKTLILFSPEAHQASKAFAEALEPRLIDDLEEIGAWAGKLHGQIVRIAALLHCCRYPATMPLSEETFLRAQRIGEYFLAHARAAFRLMGEVSQEEKDAKYILKHLNKLQEDAPTVKSLFDMCRKREGLKTMEEFRPRLDYLIERGYLYTEAAVTGGRPTERIYLNPEYRSAKGAKGAKALWEN